MKIVLSYQCTTTNLENAPRASGTFPGEQIALCQNHALISMLEFAGKYIELNLMHSAI